MVASHFNRDEAFTRNIGLLTIEEQERLRDFTIAIPGMGGVGGANLISLVRQGFEKFKIADLDVYELKNFNRQYGARIDTLDKEKVVVMREEALKINPHCSIEIYDKGISKDNIETFLIDVDLVVDGIDFFEPDVRRFLFNEALARRIPVVTAGPIGFSTAFLIFMPGGPTFDEYFAVDDHSSFTKKLLSFAVGLTPAMLQRSYMHGVSLKEKAGPSSIAGINLCAGVVTVYAIKILLHKGSIKAVPYYHQFDVMKDKYVVRKMIGGNKNPLQKMKLRAMRKFFNTLS